jgi:hypothetical protein
MVVKKADVMATHLAEQWVVDWGIVMVVLLVAQMAAWLGFR